MNMHISKFILLTLLCWKYYIKYYISSSKTKVPLQKEVKHIFLNTFGIYTFVCSHFMFGHKIPNYLSCLGECTYIVMLWSSRNVLWTMKHHITFHWHAGERWWLCFHLGENCSFNLLRVKVVRCTITSWLWWWSIPQLSVVELNHMSQNKSSKYIAHPEYDINNNWTAQFIVQWDSKII